MTTLAKIEANRRNGQLSTGPRTAEGKVIVARNATKHGIFAAVPVLPDECPEAWETHRTGVVASLAPVGLLEVNLAERAALLLWRFQRLARYEVETVANDMEGADVPPLPRTDDSQSRFDSMRERKTRDEQLRHIGHELRTAREELAEIGPARDVMNTMQQLAPDAVVPFAVAESILEAACSRAETAENLKADPPAFGSKPFLRKIDVREPDAAKVGWTPEIVCRGLTFYAVCAREDPARFLEGVRADLVEWVEELARRVRRLEREAGAVARLLDDGATRKRATKLLPADGRDERIAKYERHLHSLLTSTLHELERLQARREGEPVPPPAVADVNVTVGAQSG